MSLPPQTITPADLRILGERLAAADEFGLDYETTSDHPLPRAPLHFDKMRVAGAGFAFADRSKTYIPMLHSQGTNAPMHEATELIRKVLSDKKKTAHVHGGKFEMAATRSMGFKLECGIYDSLISAWILNYGLEGGDGHKLKPLVKTYLKHKMIELDDVLPPGTRIHEVHPDEIAPYCGDDALQAMMLNEHWFPEIKDLGMWKVYTELEMPFIRVLRHMEDVGCAFDQDVIDQIKDEFGGEMDGLKADFEALTGVQISSNTQVSRRLYDELKWWPVNDDWARGKNGLHSVGAGNLEEVEKMLQSGKRHNPAEGVAALKMKSRYQRISKLVSTYTHSMIERANQYPDQRLRSNWKQHGTGTGRLASTDPNLQNIPIRTPEGIRIREAFVATDETWRLWDVDYSQADLRMMAHLSKDPMLMKAYLEDIDLHQQTADNADCDRGTGKTLNLGLIYEMGVNTLAGNLQCSNSKATRLYTAWHSTYRRVKPYHKRMHTYAEEHGYVRTITGRIRRIHLDKAKTWGQKNYWLRQASNTPDQGSVADVIKLAMRNAFFEWEKRGLMYDYFDETGKVKMVAQVHDELLMEFKEDFAEEGAADMIRHMENAVELRVPMKVESKFGDNWRTAH